MRAVGLPRGSPRIPSRPHPFPTAPVAPRARRPDFALGLERLSRHRWWHFRRRAGREVAADPASTPSRKCRTASTPTPSLHFEPEHTGGCGRVGNVLGRGAGGWEGPFSMSWEAAGLPSWASWLSCAPWMHFWGPPWHPSCLPAYGLSRTKSACLSVSGDMYGHLVPKGHW